MSEKITNVKEFINAAVLEGVKRVPHSFIYQLEESLKKDIAIAKAGSVDNYLQEMINSAISEEESE